MHLLFSEIRKQTNKQKTKLKHYAFNFKAKGFTVATLEDETSVKKRTYIVLPTIDSGGKLWSF